LLILSIGPLQEKRRQFAGCPEERLATKGLILFDCRPICINFATIISTSRCTERGASIGYPACYLYFSDVGLLALPITAMSRDHGDSFPLSFRALPEQATVIQGSGGRFANPCLSPPNLLQGEVENLRLGTDPHHAIQAGEAAHELCRDLHELAAGKHGDGLKPLRY